MCGFDPRPEHPVRERKAFAKGGSGWRLAVGNTCANKQEDCIDDCVEDCIEGQIDERQWVGSGPRHDSAVLGGGMLND